MKWIIYPRGKYKDNYDCNDSSQQLFKWKMHKIIDNLTCTLSNKHRLSSINRQKLYKKWAQKWYKNKNESNLVQFSDG